MSYKTETYLGKFKLCFETQNSRKLGRGYCGVYTCSPDFKVIWWCDAYGRYLSDEEAHGEIRPTPVRESYTMTTRRDIHSLRAFKRHLRRHCNDLPVGSSVRLKHPVYGNDVIAEIVQ